MLVVICNIHLSAKRLVGYEINITVEIWNKDLLKHTPCRAELIYCIMSTPLVSNHPCMLPDIITVELLFNVLQERHSESLSPTAGDGAGNLCIF